MTSSAAFGGRGWRSRETDTRDELGSVWARCGVQSEWEPLRSVLIHRPGAELEGLKEPDAHLMLALPDPIRARAQHDALAAAYRAEGVRVEYVNPPVMPPPNQMFVADLVLMTPSGAIVARPASPVRAGEERWVARRLAELGVPILRSVAGRGVFEGADALWLRADRVMIGRGLRTNREGAGQVASTLSELGVESVMVDLPRSTMHLMGGVRIVDRQLAFVVPGRVPASVVEALHAVDYRVQPLPVQDGTDGRTGGTMGANFVVVGPRRVLMPAGDARLRGVLEGSGVECVEIEVDEIARAAGAIGCMTGILERGGG